MKWIIPAALMLSALPVHSQETVVTWDDMLDSATEWARENIDTGVLRSVQENDPESVNRFLTSMQSQLQGEYVVDLARWRGTAKLLLPVLESRSATAPYAAWLKARLDYLEVASELRLRIPAPGSNSIALATNSIATADADRKIWREQMEHTAWPERARGYVPQLKPLFEREKVPPELVWIAEVESSFNATARSPAGAVGLFQLMPATAAQYGLEVAPVDQRTHPESSAVAAARHLAYLFNRFRDWRLALAAYNAGEGRVQRLLDLHRARTFDEIATHLPAETRMYVPKIEAVLLRREGTTLSQLSVPGQIVEAN